MQRMQERMQRMREQMQRMREQVQRMREWVQRMREWGDGQCVVQRMRTANDVLYCASSWRVVTQIRSVCDSEEWLSGSHNLLERRDTRHEVDVLKE
jgi:hypothetical protein